MKNRVKWLIAGALSICVVFTAYAEQHNVGFYTLTDYDGDTAIWTLYESTYIKGVSEVESRYGDFYVSPYGAGDDGNCCLQVQGSTSPGSQIPYHARSAISRRVDRTSSGDAISTAGEDRYVLEEIQASGISLPNERIYSWEELDVGGGGSRYIGVPMPEVPGPSSNILSCPPGSIAQALESLLKKLWEDSEVDDDVPMEQGGIFVPDGQGGWTAFMTFEPDLCRVHPPSVDQWPSSIPPGAIFVHTHPAVPGRATAGCGGIYPGGPSDSDRDNLAYFRSHYGTTDIQGIVIDEMLVYHYEPDKDKTKDKGTFRRCGY